MQMRYRSCVKFTDDAKVDELKRAGCTIKEIAAQLGISERTVKAHSSVESTHNTRQHDEAVKRLEQKLSEMEYGRLVYVSGSTRKPTLKCLDCGAEFTSSRALKVGCPTCWKNRPKKSYYFTPKIDRTKPRMCLECGEEFIPADKTGRFTRIPNYCSKKCQAKASSRKSRYKRRAAGAGYGTYSWHRIYERDNGCCYLCGEPVDMNDYVIRDGAFIAGPNYPSVDHVVPLSKGGSNTEENMRLAHCLCNSLKSAN